VSRVLLVDDQPLVRAGLRMVFETEPDLEVVGEAADGVEAVAQVRETRPDVVLMDVRMPRMDGLAATRQILAQQSSAETRVLVLTTFDEDEHAYEALRAGASGFLIKDTPVEQLADAVRVVANGQALLAPTTTRRLVEEMVTRRSTGRPPSTFGRLTERERDVVGLLARGLTNQEIAGQLFVTEATAKTHVSRILTKLELRDRVHVVIAAYEWGLVQPGSARTD
jgi:DNA-binding NarL/FixJ family response regulator